MKSTVERYLHKGVQYLGGKKNKESVTRVSWDERLKVLKWEDFRRANHISQYMTKIINSNTSKIRNLSVTLSRGSNMAVDSSKQKRDKCQVEGQGEVDEHPPVPEYVQWNDDRKVNYCSDVSFDISKSMPILVRPTRKKKMTRKRSTKTIPISSPT